MEHCLVSEGRRVELLLLAFSALCAVEIFAFPRKRIYSAHALLSFSQLPPTQTKIVVLAALVASASAFAPAVQPKQATALFNEKADWEKAAELGWSMGGEDYTRNVVPKEDADARKTIHEGPSFEEYMKSRNQ